MIDTAQSEMLRAFELYGVTPKNILLADDMSALMIMISANLGIAILPEYNIESSVPMDAIVHIPMDDPKDAFPMTAIYPAVQKNPCVPQMIAMLE